jgi:iron(III) transport system ATP-binding protein
LARALATSPSLLLLDEPLSALDARVRLRLRDEIKSLQRRLGVTTVMVTHDQEEALSIADRIVVMNEGVVEQIGTPAEVYARPATMFVADFIGNMTFLSGSVKGPARVSVAAIELSCPAVNGLAPGTPVRVGLRPEEVRIRGIEPGTPNQLSVRIKALHYLGSFCRATLEPETAPGVGITSDFSANAVRDLGIAEGQTIPIVLPEEALRVFPVQETAR